MAEKRRCRKHGSSCAALQCTSKEPVRAAMVWGIAPSYHDTTDTG